jgi:putative acetyltransferase
MAEYQIKAAYDNLDEASALLQEYVETEYIQMLGVALEFQQINEELENPQDKYAQDTGGLYLIYWHDEAAGCIAFRRLDATTCEIKRLYVRKQFRGHQLGEKALLHVLNEAKHKGYRIAYCDTLSSKKTAIALYKKIGFTETTPYYQNPLPDVLYLMKILH